MYEGVSRPADALETYPMGQSTRDLYGRDELPRKVRPCRLPGTDAIYTYSGSTNSHTLPWVGSGLGSACDAIYLDPSGPHPNYSLNPRVSPIALSRLYDPQIPAAPNPA